METRPEIVFEIHETNAKIIPRPMTREELDNIFVYWETADGGLIGYFPSKVYGKNPQDSRNDPEEMRKDGKQ